MDFYGAVAKRVFVVGSANFKTSHYNMCKKFNSLRNYRYYDGEYPVEIIRKTCFPDISSFKPGDVCLLLGHGRFIDHATLTFVALCICNSIPVYFIRANSNQSDSRAPARWRYNNVITVYNKHFLPPENYFMEITSLKDFIPVKNFGFAALLPAAVPMY